MSAAPSEHDVRLRKDLRDPLPQPVPPDGISIRTLREGDQNRLHVLLSRAFVDQVPFAAWWPSLRDDNEFDPMLCFLAIDERGRLAGAVQCWTSAFIKDLAVDPEVRGKGIGKALMLFAFHAFQARGVGHVDLKTNRMKHASAYRLYRRLGMAMVDWSG